MNCNGPPPAEVSCELGSGKNKRKAEKPPQKANKTVKTRKQQLKASEASQTCAQPKKKKVKSTECSQILRKVTRK